MAETLLTELAGVPLYERCNRGERPHSFFEVASSNDAAQQR